MGKFSRTTILSPRANTRYKHTLSVDHIKCSRCTKEIDIGTRIHVRGKGGNKRAFHDSCFQQLYFSTTKAVK